MFISPAYFHIFDVLLRLPAQHGSGSSATNGDTDIYMYNKKLSFNSSKIVPGTRYEVLRSIDWRIRPRMSEWNIRVHTYVPGTLSEGWYVCDPVCGR